MPLCFLKLLIWISKIFIFNIFSGAAPTYTNFQMKCIYSMNSTKMKSLANYKTLDEQLKACLPLEQFLAREIAAQKSIVNKFAPIGMSKI